MVTPIRHQRQFRLSTAIDKRLRFLARTTGLNMRQIVERSITNFATKYDMIIVFDDEHISPTGYNVIPGREVDLAVIIGLYLETYDPTFVAMPDVVYFEIYTRYTDATPMRFEYDRERAELRRR